MAFSNTLAILESLVIPLMRNIINYPDTKDVAFDIAIICLATSIMFCSYLSYSHKLKENFEQLNDGSFVLLALLLNFFGTIMLLRQA